MLSRWLFAVLLTAVFPASLAAQEPYLVAYAGFAGFQAPVWAPMHRGAEPRTVAMSQLP